MGWAYVASNWVRIVLGGKASMSEITVTCDARTQRDLEAEGAVLPPIQYCRCEEDVAQLRNQLRELAGSVERITEALSHYFDKRNSKI